jgi:hypothetical protein
MALSHTPLVSRSLHGRAESTHSRFLQVSCTGGADAGVKTRSLMCVNTATYDIIDSGRALGELCPSKPDDRSVAAASSGAPSAGWQTVSSRAVAICAGACLFRACRCLLAPGHGLCAWQIIRTAASVRKSARVRKSQLLLYDRSLGRLLRSLRFYVRPSPAAPVTLMS